MVSERVTFTGAEGQELAGRLHKPAGKIRAYALFAHCFTCTKSSRAAVHIADALADAGFGVLRFDFTGLGESEGDFAATNLSSNVTDLVAAAKYLAQKQGAPTLLVGHSLGGAAVLQAATQIASVTAVATIGSPARASHVRHLFADAQQDIEARGEAEVLLGGRPFRIRKQFLDDLEGQPLPESLRRLRRALLVMHSPVDDIVPIDNAAEIFTNALHPKSFISLDNADHLLSRAADSRYAGRVLAAWAQRYLPAEEAEAVDDDTSAPGVVRAVTREGFLTRLSAGGHALVADEPAGAGGTGKGPSPYDLLAAALASCTSMTLRMYANHKKLKVEKIDVAVRNSRVHASDCENCESSDGYVHLFEREIALEGDLESTQRQRMLEIADRCPVHRTLENEIRISSRLLP